MALSVTMKAEDRAFHARFLSRRHSAPRGHSRPRPQRLVGLTDTLAQRMKVNTEWDNRYYLSPRGLAVWFTGFSGAGKTTLCRALEPALRAMGYSVHVLDGEDIRKHLSRDLGFSKKDRDEHVFRIGCVARSLVREHAIVLVAAISPYRDARSRVRELIGEFLEVHVDAPIETCMQRDPKGLYALALAGRRLAEFTGVSDPYEPPLEPRCLECRTDHVRLSEESIAKVLGGDLSRRCKSRHPTSERASAAGVGRSRASRQYGALWLGR